MLSIIWNATYACPWDCVFCCVDAGECQKAEMSHAQKLTVADKLSTINCRIDLSGGEAMLNKEGHLHLLEYLSRKLGKERVGLSCSGWGIDDVTAKRLASVVGDVEMTMDAHPDTEYAHRPARYHKTAALASKTLKRHGISVGLQTVITREHLDPRILTNLYVWLCENGIDAWSILKFFPSGRGCDYTKLMLSDDECKRVVRFICSMDKFHFSTVKPKIDIHYLMPGSSKSPECRCVRKSVGILPDGKVTACFWGLSKDGMLSENRFYLGNICTESMEDILASKHAAYWNCRQGGCALAEQLGIVA